MIRPLFIFALALGFTIGEANAAPIIGINFNNNDSAGAQASGNTFGATWTDMNSFTGTGTLLNGTSNTVSMDWSFSGFWSAGSWDGSSGWNSGISSMRVYLDDGDLDSDGIGIRIALSGLADWLDAENMTAYTVTIYASSDENHYTFGTFNVGSGTVSVAVNGNGSWDGIANDPNGNLSKGVRGIGISDEMALDTLTITGQPRNGSIRSSIAAVVITAVPEPSTALLGGLGLLVFLRRRR